MVGVATFIDNRSKHHLTKIRRKLISDIEEILTLYDRNSIYKILEGISISSGIDLAILFVCRHRVCIPISTYAMVKNP